MSSASRGREPEQSAERADLFHKLYESGWLATVLGPVVDEEVGQELLVLDRERRTASKTTKAQPIIG